MMILRLHVSMLTRICIQPFTIRICAVVTGIYEVLVKWFQTYNKMTNWNESCEINVMLEEQQMERM